MTRAGDERRYCYTAGLFLFVVLQLWSNEIGKSHTVAAHHMQEGLPSGHCGKRAVWDIPVHHTRSTLHNAECNPPEPNKDVCLKTQIYLGVC